MAAQRTLAGPHRDELDVIHAAKRVPAAQSSTGEQKAMLVAMTLAHAALAAEGRASLLLLDEVAAHLDPVRRAALFDAEAEEQPNYTRFTVNGMSKEPYFVEVTAKGIKKRLLAVSAPGDGEEEEGHWSLHASALHCLQHRIDAEAGESLPPR